MSYSVEILPSAIKELIALPRQAQEGITAAIDGLTDQPFPPGVKKLQGRKKPPFWRMRVGDYRIIYQVDGQAVKILVVKIGHRRDVYRGR